MLDFKPSNKPALQKLADPDMAKSAPAWQNMGEDMMLSPISFLECYVVRYVLHIARPASIDLLLSKDADDVEPAEMNKSKQPKTKTKPSPEIIKAHQQAELEKERVREEAKAKTAAAAKAPKAKAVRAPSPPSISDHDARLAAEKRNQEQDERAARHASKLKRTYLRVCTRFQPSLSHSLAHTRAGSGSSAAAGGAVQESQEAAAVPLAGGKRKGASLTAFFSKKSKE